MITNNNSFRLRLLHAMQRANLRQIELSEKTGISRAMISQYLAGAYIPKQTNLYKLAQALNVSVEYLLGLYESQDDTINTASDELKAVARRIETEFEPEDAKAISQALDILKSYKKK